MKVQAASIGMEVNERAKDFGGNDAGIATARKACETVWAVILAVLFESVYSSIFLRILDSMFLSIRVRFQNPGAIEILAFSFKLVELSRCWL